MEKEMIETKEIVIALIHLAKILRDHLVDGVTIDDLKILKDLVSDPVYRRAIAGINQIPSEIKEMTVDDILDLVKIIMDEIEKELV